jgi:hypothetical protein
MDEEVYRPVAPKPGFGNLLILLTVCKAAGVKYVHEDIFDYEFSNCFTLHGFTVTAQEGRQPHLPIYINKYHQDITHPLCREIIHPTAHLEMLADQHSHLLDGVTLGVKIRRGNWSADSTQFEGSTDPKFYFCSDAGLERFKTVIHNNEGRVYITSDSPSTKNHLKEIFGDKVTMLDTVYTHTAEQDDETVHTVKNLQDVYLSWYLLSKCPRVLVTAGRGDMVGFSTFGYMAAVYGRVWPEFIFNEG